MQITVLSKGGSTIIQKYGQLKKPKISLTGSAFSLFVLFSSSSSSSGSTGAGVNDATKCHRISWREVVWMTLHRSQLKAWINYD